jgi:hypothetical protein
MGGMRDVLLTLTQFTVWLIGGTLCLYYVMYFALTRRLIRLDSNGQPSLRAATTMGVSVVIAMVLTLWSVKLAFDFAWPVPNS